ncbi:unnamed protein product [Moneuplotes crassus]|uniref:C2H2-type domain-containing protein n=1 Tax=Euplotes crassus TaxID=5936 RepID=A0AAD1Y6Q1_EUPCR|nr:unnamed protein product [Moneuplotes crassus]
MIFCKKSKWPENQGLDGQGREYLRRQTIILPSLNEVFENLKVGENVSTSDKEYDLQRSSLITNNISLSKLPSLSHIELNLAPLAQKNSALCHKTSSSKVASPSSFPSAEHIPTQKRNEVNQSVKTTSFPTQNSSLISNPSLESSDYPQLPSRPQSARFHCSFPKCKKFFSSPIARDSHLRYHYKDRPHHCHLCSKSYTQNGNLIKHLRSHATPSIDRRRVHTCEFCNRRYTEKYNLKNHQFKIHPVEYQRKYNTPRV